MNQKLLYLFTRTALHLGAGTSVGAVDQPIQRERHTGFPIIPGSSVKGVLRDCAERDPAVAPMVAKIFGDEDAKSAGVLSFGEARILAFPVRSARGSFALITCPLALERFRRARGDLDKMPSPIKRPPEEPAEARCFAGDKLGLPFEKPVAIILEEYRFELAGPFQLEWEAALLGLLDDEVWKVAKGRFVLLNNGDFSHFVRNACEINQHVRISDQTGTAAKGGLFDLEAVPAETLFFAPITVLPRATDEFASVRQMIERKRILQFGGDGTTGLGFCTVKLA